MIPQQLEQYISDPTIWEAIKFVFLAAIRTFLIDIVIWRFVVALMEKYPWTWSYVKRWGLNVYSYSHGLIFIVSSITSYILNRFITFEKGNVDSETRVFIEFMSVSLVSLGISVWVLNILTSNKRILKFIEKLPVIPKFWPMIAKVITILIVMVVNFTGYKLFVFD